MKIKINNYLKITELLMIWIIVIASVCNNLPTTFMSIANILLIAVWILSGNYKNKYIRIIQNPAAIISLALLALYLLGTTYSTASIAESLSSLSHYHKLLIIPIIISTITEDKYRDYALNGFLFSSIIVLMISYLKWIEIIPHTDTGEGYTAFKNRIAGSIFMTFSMYLMLYKSLITPGKTKYLWIILTLLSIFDVFVLINGRTGQVLILMLIAWFSFEIWKSKAIKYWLTASALGLIIFQISPELPKSRLFNTQAEIQNHNIQGQQTSAGLRLEFYKNTLNLIQNQPVFGTGTGSFLHEYQLLANQQDLITINVSNPHNQFLLTTQELGITGLITLFIFLIIPWRMSYKLPSIYYGIALRGLILTISFGSLFNSLLFDSSEGKFYCILAGVLLSSYKKSNAYA